MSVRNGSQFTGVPWDLRLAGHTSATYTFLISYVSKPIFGLMRCMGVKSPLDISIARKFLPAISRSRVKMTKRQNCKYQTRKDFYYKNTKQQKNTTLRIWGTRSCIPEFRKNTITTKIQNGKTVKEIIAEFTALKYHIKRFFGSWTTEVRWNHYSFPLDIGTELDRIQSSFQIRDWGIRGFLSIAVMWST